jgi:SNF2 family DNA or RNA helicase
MTYFYKTKPYDHQHEEFIRHGNDEARGRFWEQGTGKTKPTIDEAAYQYEQGSIDALLVLAPNGVHRNWISDEIPAHMPDRVLEKTRCHIWYSTDSKKHLASFESVLAHEGLAVLVMSYDAVMTARGCKAWKKFLKSRRCIYVLDESQRIKNPGAKRSKRIVGSHTAAPYRRCLSGTPVANSPFDVYNQLRFLDPEIWIPFGIRDFGSFKQFFGVWETWQTHNGQTYPKCIAYRNLEILNRLMAELGSRILKEDCLDLPPKIYSKRYFDLSSRQAELYQQMKDEVILELETGDLTTMLAIVRLLRFQQITCGYLPVSDDDRTLAEIPGGNPRLDLLVDTCEDLEQKAIIWCRFRKDIELINRHKFFSAKNKCVVADGSVTGVARSANLDAFQKGDVPFLLGNPAAIGTGVTLHAAKTSIYYSNSFNYEQRSQSEDRNHRIGQDSPVDYVDLVAQLSGADTVDVRIVEALRNKQDVASQITGDSLKSWI